MYQSYWLNNRSISKGLTKVVSFLQFWTTVKDAFKYQGKKSSDGERFRSYQNHEVEFISFRDSIDLFPENSESQMDGAKGVNTV